MSTSSGYHLTSYSTGVEVLFPGEERPSGEDDYTSRFCATVRNEWVYTSSPSTCLQCVGRSRFTFHMLFIFNLMAVTSDEMRMDT